jgi:diguanylate cyclase (GGDEF)-like protein
MKYSLASPAAIDGHRTMKLEALFLRSKLGRRLFLLFVISALVPVTGLALFSLQQAKALLSELNYRQLHQASKTFGLSLYERLLSLEAEMQGFRLHPGAIPKEQDESGAKTATGLSVRFKSLNWIVHAGQCIPLEHGGEECWQPKPTEGNHLRAGKTVLLSVYRPRFAAQIFMIRLLDPEQPQEGFVLGEVDPCYLWGDEHALDLSYDLCILDQSDKALFCSPPQLEAITADVKLRLVDSSSGGFNWRQADQRFLASYWAIFLAPQFSAPRWTVILSRPEAEVLEPMANFGNIFVAAILLALLVVAFASNYQVRRNLVPLEKLMAGIGRLAGKDFNRPVDVDSGDEFEELAKSFNAMAACIDKQFHALRTMADLDRVILSTFKAEDIVAVVLTRTHEVLPHDLVSMVLINGSLSEVALVYTAEARPPEGIGCTPIAISAQEIEPLLAGSPPIVITPSSGPLPRFLSPLAKLGANSFLLLPIMLKDSLAAVICLGSRQLQLSVSEEDWLQACDFTDRIAAALSHAAWEEQLCYSAHYDVLTALPNRRLLQDRLQQALAQAERQHSLVAVLFLDLDRFKAINDSLGHTAGDQLLVEMGGRLRRIVRQEDTVCRLGGDEFIVVVPHIGNQQDALSLVAAVAKKILAVAARPFMLEEHEVRLTASIGVAFYPWDGTNSSELLKNADSALYHAKARGRGSYQFYARELNAAALERLDIENKLHAALDNGEFELHYQAQVELGSLKIVGAEALIRWHHPHWGLVPPKQFIPLAEGTGLIVPIGEWTLNVACAQNSAWHEQGFSALKIGVNLSGLQFRQADLIDKVEIALEKAGLEAGRLEIEITEGVAMEDFDRTIAILGALQAMGIRIAIDDFGTGYCSLNCLKRLPIHALKIDRSFIVNLLTDNKDAAIVKSAIDLAHNLGIEVIAEGVETQSQVDYLRKLGCEQAQGYLFSRPLGAPQFAELLRAERKLFSKDLAKS